MDEGTGNVDGARPRTRRVVTGPTDDEDASDSVVASTRAVATRGSAERGLA
jgi:hypothetical protein